MPRLFIAIDLPNSLKQALAVLPGQYPGARWHPPELMHITIRFLGEKDNVEEIKSALATVKSPPFELSIEGVGSFEPKRAIWARVAQSEALTSALQ